MRNTDEETERWEYFVRMPSLAILSLLLLCTLVSADYRVWASGMSMCPPRCSTGWATMNTHIKPAELRIGDTICWHLKPDQIEKYWKVSRGAVDLKQLALNMALGLPIRKLATPHMSYACHALVWKNTTNFMTKGSNTPIEDFDMSFSKNYIGRLDYD